MSYNRIKGKYSEEKNIKDKVYVPIGHFGTGWGIITDRSLIDRTSIHVSPLLENGEIKFSLGLWLYTDMVMNEQEYRNYLIEQLETE